MLASNFMGRPEAIYLCRVFFIVGGFLLAALSPMARRLAPLPARRGLPCSSPCRSAPGERGGRGRALVRGARWPAEVRWPARRAVAGRGEGRRTQL